MTQSAMCIPLWPARNGNTAHLAMCPFAGGSSSAFRHWQAEQLADCALSLVTAGARSPSPSGTAQKHYTTGGTAGERAGSIRIA